MKLHLHRLAPIVLTILSVTAVRVAAQDNPRQLFEAGKYQAVIDNSDNSPASQYLKGLSYLRLNQPDAAKDAFRKLESADDAWQSVGRSAVALIDNDRDAALQAARAAVASNASLAEAHYQLGRVLEATGDHAAAADAFVKATEDNPQMAYAHYYAAMNYYQAKKIDKMAIYFEYFLRLAPNAPERPAVESTMRTVRGK